MKVRLIGSRAVRDFPIGRGGTNRTQKSRIPCSVCSSAVRTAAPATTCKRVDDFRQRQQSVFRSVKDLPRSATTASTRFRLRGPGGPPRVRGGTLSSRRRHGIHARRPRAVSQHGRRPRNQHQQHPINVARIQTADLKQKARHDSAEKRRTSNPAPNPKNGSHPVRKTRQ